ncbi:hypothetical protein CDAR_509031 [Caerostris darwini]|uniref:Uncharacterized protein n=1 Tax=Caerostris darwini TaxID=1538125 RepID=A0AAV4N1S5_9ARAC|nr:hypothetical protein CDAR_509031 [Caerostris darwini]
MQLVKRFMICMIAILANAMRENQQSNFKSKPDTLRLIVKEVGSAVRAEDGREEDIVCESSHSTDSEISSDGNDFSDPEAVSHSMKYYYGKNRFKWSSVEANRNVRNPL